MQHAAADTSLLNEVAAAGASSSYSPAMSYGSSPPTSPPVAATVHPVGAAAALPPPAVQPLSTRSGKTGKTSDSGGGTPRTLVADHVQVCCCACSRETSLGVACLVVCLVAWETMGELLQDVNLEYPKPSLLTYVVHSAYALVLLPWLVYRWGALRAALLPHAHMAKLALKVFPLMFAAAYFWYVSLAQTLVAANNAIYQTQCVFVYVFSILLIGDRLQCGKATALVLCVSGVCFVVISSADQSSAKTAAPAPSSSSGGSSGGGGGSGHIIHETLFGYFCLIGSVVSFALYEVLFKREELLGVGDGGGSHRVSGSHGAGTPGSGAEGAGAAAGGKSVSERAVEAEEDNEGADANAESFEGSIVFLGCCGLVNIVLGLPIVLVLSATGVEPLDMPSHDLLRQILLNAFLDVFFNFAFIWGVALCGPLFMSTGTILIIPVGICVDAMLGKGEMTGAGLVGVVLIAGGFCMLNVSGMPWVQRQAAAWWARVAGSGVAGGSVKYSPVDPDMP